MMTPPEAAPRRSLLTSLTSWLDAGAGLAEFDSDKIDQVDWMRVVPFIGMHVACFAVFFVGASTTAVVTAIALYVIRMFAITGFYHRYFSHRSFKTSRAGQFVFALLGASAVQRGPIWWAAHHRHHHAFSDTEQDVHSPVQRGFLWSHMGWFLSRHHYQADAARVRDLARYPELRWLDENDFVAPLALVVRAAARLSPSGEPMVDLSSLGRLHIATATIGIAIFSLATMVAIIYLLQERNLKRKNFDGVLFKASASLETLELLSRRLVAIGFPIFTISMILGTIWAAQLRHGFDRIEWPLSIVTWLTFGGLVLGRNMGGVRGRKAALLTVLGFATALLVLAIYLARRAGGL